MGIGDIATILQLSFMRFITRRPYGMAYFKIDRFLFGKIVRFDKESVKTKEGIWTFDKDSIYVEKEGVKDQKTGLIRKKYQQTDFIVWKSGHPVIFLDQNDMIPRRFENVDQQHAVNPRNIQSVLNKEISAFEAELMRKQRDKLEKMLMLTLLLSAATFIFLYMVSNDVSILKEAIAKIPTETTGLNG